MSLRRVPDPMILILQLVNTTSSLLMLAQIWRRRRCPLPTPSHLQLERAWSCRIIRAPTTHAGSPLLKIPGSPTWLLYSHQRDPLPSTLAVYHLVFHVWICAFASATQEGDSEGDTHFGGPLMVDLCRLGASASGRTTMLSWRPIVVTNGLAYGSDLNDL
jgi:hypothetical protein